MSIFKICSNRILSANVPMRIGVTSRASMSSVASPPPSGVTDGKKPVKKRESFRSIMASIFGGYVDPADPNEPPIPSDLVNFPDVTEQATGYAKLLLLAFENGFIDPYCLMPIERNNRGSKDNPVLVETFFDERLVGCVCEETQNSFRFTTVYRGEPKRCACGHWMKIVDAPKFWEKIPKEDLLTIPYFMILESEGKLDKVLSGELTLEGNKIHKELGQGKH